MAFEKLKQVVNLITSNMSLLLKAFKIYISFKIASVTIIAAQGFLQLAKAITKAKTATILLNKASKKNIILLGLTGVGLIADQIFDLTGKIEELLRTAGENAGILDPNETKEIEKSA